MCIIGFTGQLDNKKKSDFSWANIWATAYLEKKMCDEGKKKEWAQTIARYTAQNGPKTVWPLLADFRSLCTGPYKTEAGLMAHAGKPAGDLHLISDWSPMATSSDMCVLPGGGSGAQRFMYRVIYWSQE